LQATILQVQRNVVLQFLKQRRRLLLIIGLLAFLFVAGLAVRDTARPRLNHPRMLRGVAGETTETELVQLLGQPGRLVEGSRSAQSGYLLEWDDGELKVRAIFEKDGKLRAMTSSMQVPRNLWDQIRQWLHL
jgi:hypothetical protein